MPLGEAISGLLTLARETGDSVSWLFIDVAESEGLVVRDCLSEGEPHGHGLFFTTLLNISSIVIFAQFWLSP